MQSKPTPLMLVLIAVLIVMSVGSVGVPVDHGQACINASASHLSLNDNFLPASFSPDFLVALFSGTRDMAYQVPQVSRARSLVSKNDNRNAILDFIRQNPGHSLADISRALNMNIGTARYHLMILALNHVVTEYRDGARIVRYFTNNGTFSRAQMEVISLLQREPTNRLLSSLVGSPGMTNAKIFASSGLQYSDINRYLKELTAKGVVTKEPLGGDKYQYSIVPGLEEFILKNKNSI